MYLKIVYNNNQLIYNKNDKPENQNNIGTRWYLEMYWDNQVL